MENMFDLTYLKDTLNFPKINRICERHIVSINPGDIFEVFSQQTIMDDSESQLSLKRPERNFSKDRVPVSQNKKRH